MTLGLEESGLSGQLMFVCALALGLRSQVVVRPDSCSQWPKDDGRASIQRLHSPTVEKCGNLGSTMKHNI